MPNYKDKKFFICVQSTGFDVLHAPLSPVHASGIYRCVGCGFEVISNTGDPLPAADHHAHSPWQGSILWQLVVACRQHAG